MTLYPVSYDLNTIKQTAAFLTGTLLEIGEGKRKPEEIIEILQAKSRPCAGFTVPAQGLYLVEVFY